MRLRRARNNVQNRKTGEVKREPKITRDMMREKIDAAKVELRGAGVDESPHCYKRLDEVLDAHGSTIRVLHTLTPVGVAMAGADEFDPYKD
jgi:tRNA-splicing ligase RtcB